MNEIDMLVLHGGAVKSLGGNRIGGHSNIFCTMKDTDTSGDFWDSDTDFDIEDGDRRSGYYNHGFDVKIGNLKIGTGTLVKDKVGIWMEAQLKERDEYVDAIMQMVEDGKLGISTGALSHLVRREAKNKAGTLNYVTHWPIGEWSLTPTPAEPRTLAMPIKTWAESLPKEPDPEPDEITPENEAAETMVKAAFSITTVRQFEDFLRDAGYSRKQATAIATHGYNSLRDAGEPEPINAPDIPAPIDEATKQARDFRMRQLSHRLEGLRLAL